MKRNIAIVAMVIAALAVFYSLRGTTAPPLDPRVSIAFLGITNTLPFPGAPEKLGSQEAVFQLTNHNALNLVYTGVARAAQVSGRGSSMTEATRNLPSHGTSILTVSVNENTNQRLFEIVVHVSQPRPAWQLRARDMAKWLRLPPIFVGTTRVYPHCTNFCTPPL